MFRTKTLDSILGTFTKTVADLESLIASAKQQRQSNTDRINSLIEENVGLADEITRASDVVGSINALIGTK